MIYHPADGESEGTLYDRGYKLLGTQGGTMMSISYDCKLRETPARSNCKLQDRLQPILLKEFFKVMETRIYIYISIVDLAVG